ncbi:MAG: sulfotransferase, partial [Parvularculaceae bacterium]
EAADHHRRAIALDPKNPEIYNNLGVALQNEGDDRAAIECFDRALRLAPALHQSLNNLAVSLEALGQIEEARSRLRLAVEARPDYAEAHRNFSRLTTYKAGDPHIDAMMRLAINASLDDEARAQLGFAIAKALIDIGEDDAAFDFLAEANRIKRSLIRYDIDEDDALFDKIKATFTAANLATFGGKGLADQAPIFIVGLPRSGTTLVEQILASHRFVEGAGELNVLNDGMVPFRPSKMKSGPPLLQGADFRALGEQYVRTVQARGAKKPRFTDKAPLNFRWIGAIRLSLPNAKVINCVRDPRDIGFSLYRNYFAAGGVRFAYDLAEIARYINLYKNLMVYWRTFLGDFIYDLDYERLVADQQGETQRLLDFCGLDFDPACLAFEKTERSVKTASAAQVREPLTDRSIGMWRRFETRLGPLLENLDVDK